MILVDYDFSTDPPPEIQFLSLQRVCDENGCRGEASCTNCSSLGLFRLNLQNYPATVVEVEYDCQADPSGALHVEYTQVGPCGSGQTATFGSGPSDRVRVMRTDYGTMNSASATIYRIRIMVPDENRAYIADFPNVVTNVEQAYPAPKRFAVSDLDPDRPLACRIEGPCADSDTVYTHLDADLLFGTAVLSYDPSTGYVVYHHLQAYRIDVSFTLSSSVDYNKRLIQYTISREMQQLLENAIDYAAAARLVLIKGNYVVNGVRLSPRGVVIHELDLATGMSVVVEDFSIATPFYVEITNYVRRYDLEKLRQILPPINFNTVKYIKSEPITVKIFDFVRLYPAAIRSDGEVYAVAGVRSLVVNNEGQWVGMGDVLHEPTGYRYCADKDEIVQIYPSAHPQAYAIASPHRLTDYGQITDKPTLFLRKGDCIYSASPFRVLRIVLPR